MNYSIPVYSILYRVGLMLGIGGATRCSILRRKEAGKQKEGKSRDTSLSYAVIMERGQCCRQVCDMYRYKKKRNKYYFEIKSPFL